MADESLRAAPSTSASSGLTPVPAVGAGGPVVVAFYLPQYHPIPENDEWWGPDFTDWVKVRDARPLYPDHLVPSVPSELGYYDLRHRDTRQHQAELARAHGIYGFCYYFYWFGGRRLLQQPLELMLADGQPDLPFCLCWANEPWSRRWDGRAQDILMPQHHDRVGDLAVLDDLMPYLEDERYIRIDGRPLLLIYRQSLLDDPVRFTASLREDAARRGLPGLFLCNVMSIGDREQLAAGFDAAVEFPPNGILVTDVDSRQMGADPAFRGRIYDYASVVGSALARPVHTFPYFPGVMPRWDNSARKGMAGQVFHGSTPQLFERWLRRASRATARRNPKAPLVFVNSWNEWAEGAHLEPDERTGRFYLEAIRRVVLADAGEPSGSPFPPTSEPQLGTEETRATTALQPGMPTLDETIDLAGSEGAAWIDSVQGEPLQGYVVSAPRGHVLRLRGWFYGDDHGRVRPARSAYLILSTDKAAWHALIPDRERRADLRRAMLARDRTTRRLVRVIDRLPSGIGGRVLQVWARHRDRIGFEITFRLDDVPAGVYRIGFAEVTAAGQRHVASDFALEVT